MLLFYKRLAKLCALLYSNKQMFNRRNGTKRSSVLYIQQEVFIFLKKNCHLCILRFTVTLNSHVFSILIRVFSEKSRITLHEHESLLCTYCRVQALDSRVLLSDSRANATILHTVTRWIGYTTVS